MNPYSVERTVFSHDHSGASTDIHGYFIHTAVLRDVKSGAFLLFHILLSHLAPDVNKSNVGIIFSFSNFTDFVR